ncbi:hypothetical protein Tco_0288448 [Tanacetum coccineum]
MKRGFRGAPRPLLPAMLLVANNPNASQAHDAVAPSKPSSSTPTPPPIPTPTPTPPPIPIPTPPPIPIPTPPPIPTPTPPPSLHLYLYKYLTLNLHHLSTSMRSNLLFTNTSHPHRNRL